ncbi:MAG: redoxin domain-containing protein [Acidobacteria bacterium]|nr:redoxin domain-containing protein [Acidobacteriota bacterium]
MSRYRDNVGKFTEVNTAVLGVSVDSVWANKAFHDQMGVDFPILSDVKKEVSREYGILDEQSGTARRTSFVIDTEGIVRHIDQARDAMDPSGAIGACSMLKKPGGQ